jgi:hypothetical protein
MSISPDGGDYGRTSGLFVFLYFVITMFDPVRELWPICRFNPFYELTVLALINSDVVICKNNFH